MILRFSLNSPFAKLALLLVALVVSGLLGRLVCAQFVVAVITDPRINMNQEALLQASTRYPQSPRVRARLAEAALDAAAGPESNLAAALLHATHAVNLSPYDFQFRRLLAKAQEANGDLNAAEKSLYAAVGLAPQHAATNWALANLLLRQGKTAESLAPFRTATTGDPYLLPAAFDLLWQAADRDLVPLKTITGAKAEAQLALTQFLLEQSAIGAAIEVYQSIDRAARLNSQPSADFITRLMAANYGQEAYALWLELAQGATVRSDATVAGSIWNGSFERAGLRHFNHFDWQFGRSDHARFMIDQSAARQGARSLRITFLGHETTKLNGEVVKLFPVAPNARYELECYARAKNLFGPEGPRLAVLHKGAMLATSAPVVADASDWQRLSVSFTAPANAPLLTIAILRIPKFSYEEPTEGAVWFDDFALRKL